MAEQITYIELKVSEKISAGQSVVESFTPDAGDQVVITEFHGSAPYGKDSCVSAVWNYDHATLPEDVRWLTYGDDNRRFLKDILPELGDGVKKLAIVCNNGEVSDKFMAGEVRLKIIRNT